MNEYVIFNHNGSQRLGRIVENFGASYSILSFNNLASYTVPKSNIEYPAVSPSLKYGDTVKIIDNYSGVDTNLHKTGSIGNVIDCIPEGDGKYYYIVNAYGIEGAYYRNQLQKGHTEWVVDEEKKEKSNSTLIDIIKSNDHIVLKYKDENVHIIHVLNDHLNKDDFNKYCMNKDMKYRYLILSGSLEPLFSNMINIKEFHKISKFQVRHTGVYKDFESYELV